MSHTPGPWNICWGTYNGQRMNFHITASPYGSVRPIAETQWKSDLSEIESQELEANAHLIAAAPDLLEALQFLRSFHSGHVIATDDLAVRLNAADAAIYKAKGESNGNHFH